MSNGLLIIASLHDSISAYSIGEQVADRKLKVRSHVCTSTLIFTFVLIHLYLLPHTFVLTYICT